MSPWKDLACAAYRTWSKGADLAETMSSIKEAAERDTTPASSEDRVPVRRWDDPAHVIECPCCAAWTAERDAWRDRALSAEAGMHLAADAARALEPASAEATPPTREALPSDGALASRFFRAWDDLPGGTIAALERLLGEVRADERQKATAQEKDQGSNRDTSSASGGRGELPRQEAPTYLEPMTDDPLDDAPPEVRRRFMVGGFAPGNETPNNRSVTIGTGAPVSSAGEADQGAAGGAGSVAGRVGDPDRNDASVGGEHRAWDATAHAALDPDGGPRAPVDAPATPRMVDDYTRVERLLVAHGPPRNAGTTLAMAIEKLVWEVRQEERQCLTNFFGQDSGVDVDAYIAWMRGEGPEPEGDCCRRAVERVRERAIDKPEETRIDWRAVAEFAVRADDKISREQAAARVQAAREFERTQTIEACAFVAATCNPAAPSPYWENAQRAIAAKIRAIGDGPLPGPSDSSRDSQGREDKETP